jgi:hypothetical protein
MEFSVMDDCRWPRRSAFVALAVLLLPACTARTPVEELPSAHDTLRAVGRRLSRALSAEELTRLATRGDRVVAALTAAEREALGRGYLRFRVDRPVVVDVAVGAGSVAFWLADQGFRPTGWTLSHPDTKLAVYRKSFEAGWVGLGVNGLDWSAATHYAVFVRAVGGGSVRLGPADPKCWRAVTAEDGASAAYDAEKPLGRLPDALRGATLLQTAHQQRHSTLLARGRVWKTRVPSSREPDQIALAFGPSSARSLVWTWRTDPSVTQTVLRLAPAAPGGAGPADRAAVRVVSGGSRVIESPDLLNDPVVRRHRVQVNGLEPDTAYAYALGDGTASAWSRWRTVRTGPERPQNVRFLYLGDAQCGLEVWGKLLHRAYQRFPDAGFILLAGDLVDRGNERTNWDHFFLRAAGVFVALPLMPCAGNHEYLDQGPRLFRAFFDLPRNGPLSLGSKSASANGPQDSGSGLVYSFEYAGVFVAVLDSTPAAFDRCIARRQANWLDAALRNTRAAWKLVMFHHPVYASHETREYPELRAAWVPVFDKHHVDLVLQGHDHAYLRTYPLRHGRRAATNTEGTVYVVSVSGEKFAPQRPRDYTAVGFTDRPTYQTIEIQAPANRLVFRAWDAQDREIDQFVIEKPRPGTPALARRGFQMSND